MLLLLVFQCLQLETSLRFLDAGMVTVVTTDSHHLACRPPILAEARHALAVRNGQTATLRLADLDPSKIFATNTSR